MPTLLSDLEGIRSIYIAEQERFLNDVVIPCLKSSIKHDCMMGYFSSGSLKEMSPGLAEFINNGGEMRLLISPVISEQDQEAMAIGVSTPAEIAQQRLFDLLQSEPLAASAIAKHTLKCLSYLISNGQIKIKIVIKKEGIFHPKVRIFSDGHNCIATSGSGNLTSSGVTSNFEQAIVSRSWCGEENVEIINKLTSTFTKIWCNSTSEELYVFDLPSAVRNKLLETYEPNSRPQPTDYQIAVQQDELIQARINAIPSGKDSGFRPPSGLNVNSGDYSHQGVAVSAWEDASSRGILEMATGSGKTITALVCAWRRWRCDKSLLIVISAPFLPLVRQWKSEAEHFGLLPILPGDENSKREKFTQIARAVRRLRYGQTSVECLIVTNSLLSDDEFLSHLKKHTGNSLLIADEVHNLGSARFRESAPDSFTYRLGLSATPDRQYDADGTAFLHGYFGPVVFRFSLEEAIGKCLVPYEYFVHPISLTHDEIDEYVDLSAKIMALGWRANSGTRTEGQIPEAVKLLLLKRRSIVELAANKILSLKQALCQRGIENVHHSLVYASDKGRSQLDQVNHLLMDELSIKAHQLTASETKNGCLSERILKNFASGTGLQAITAMRVLDEGIDIPEIKTAYILASTTVERQWTQRRGRVLRKSKATHKPYATIHDFIVVPSLRMSNELKQDEVFTIFKQELDRVYSFAKLSMNRASHDGALSTITPYMLDHLRGY